MGLTMGEKDSFGQEHIMEITAKVRGNYRW